ncbi:MAG: divalent-cation tolerance protein CutA [Burkholderiaceae bacterium]
MIDMIEPPSVDAASERDVVIVLSTAPDVLLAKRIAHILVEEGLAACVNLGAACLSMYMWKGKLEGAEEVPLTIKTTRMRLRELSMRLAQLHPYEVPEVLVVPVSGGSSKYLDWVRQRTMLSEGN